MARDWLKDLWLSSFKGVPFWTERDQESGGRRIVKHQFPMRDPPFLEDLGEDLREFDVTAYLASDAADAESAALVAACASRGAGILVMPVQGPVMVRCVSWSRDSFKDRAGYIAFSLKCTREGASSAMVSVAMSANLVFAAAESVASSIATSFLDGLALVGLPDYVVGGVVAGVQDGIATLEALRSTEPVDVTASSTQRRAIASLFDLAPVLVPVPVATGEAAVSVAAAQAVLARSVQDVNGVVTDPSAIENAGPAAIPLQVIAIARALGDALPPVSAVRAFEAVVTEPGFASVVVPGRVYPTPGRRAEAENAEQVFRLLRLAALTAYCEAVARVPLADRPAGITLRANVAEYFEAEVGDLPPSQLDLIRAIGALRDATIAYLSRKVVDLAPVIRLEANLPMPSVFWAWRLYQDPSRASELVARNRVVHPSFMPAQFEALAP